MKKKGLIVATIVMVLVLAVSLTTATYAWFSNEGTASITAIDFAVASSADILIGVSATNGFNSTPIQSHFYSGETVYSAGAWSSDQNSLGLQVNTGLDLSNLDGAVYSFSAATPSAGGYSAATMSTYTRTTASSDTRATASIGQQITAGINADATYVLIGEGNGAADAFDVTTLTTATKQTDYLDIVLGSAPGKESVLAYGCMVYIHPTDTSKTTLGLNAAIHVAYQLNSTGTMYEYDMYGAKTYGDLRSSVTAPSLPSVTIGGTPKTLSSTITPAVGDAYLWIPIYTASSTTATADTTAIDQLRLVIYLCGPDGDCLSDGTGVGATITIEYLSINQTQWSA